MTCLSLFTFRLGVRAFLLSLLAKVLSLSAKFLDDLAKILGVFIKNLAKTKKKALRLSQKNNLGSFKPFYV